MSDADSDVTPTMDFTPKLFPHSITKKKSHESAAQSKTRGVLPVGNGMPSNFQGEGKFI